MSTPASFTLTSPHALDLTAFAQTTGTALGLLKPWLSQTNNESPVVRDIAQHAATYVQGIQLGVKAAYSGFTVTEDVLFLADALPVDDPKELEEFLVGMMQSVREARRNATATYETFHNVRRDFIQLSLRLRSEVDNGTSTFNQPSNAEGLVVQGEVLAQFCDNISSFISWWDWARVEAQTGMQNQPDQYTDISFHINSLRDPMAVQRWRNLRAQYVNYVNLVSQIEDYYDISLGPNSAISTAKISDKNVSGEPLESDLQNAPVAPENGEATAPPEQASIDHESNLTSTAACASSDSSNPTNGKPETRAMANSTVNPLRWAWKLLSNVLSISVPFRMQRNMR